MIDVEGVKKVLKPECITCNYYEELGKGTLCNDCPFCKNSSVKKGEPSRVGIKHSVFLPLGFTKQQCANIGKCQLFMFLYYPHLNWSPPPIPDYDNYGFPVNKEKARQSIHHLNGDHNDDRKENLTWNLLSDHIRNEQVNFKQKRFLKESILKNATKIGIKK